MFLSTYYHSFECFIWPVEFHLLGIRQADLNIINVIFTFVFYWIFYRTRMQFLTCRSCTPIFVIIVIIVLLLNFGLFPIHEWYYILLIVWRPSSAVFYYRHSLFLLTNNSWIPMGHLFQLYNLDMRTVMAGIFRRNDWVPGLSLLTHNSHRLSAYMDLHQPIYN